MAGNISTGQSCDAEDCRCMGKLQEICECFCSKVGLCYRKTGLFGEESRALSQKNRALSQYYTDESDMRCMAVPRHPDSVRIYIQTSFAEIYVSFAELYGSFPVIYGQV